MWFNNAVFYQFYPMGICGVEKENNWNWNNQWNGARDPIEASNPENIRNLSKWISHLNGLGVNAVYFSPIFQSDSHGYDTRDYYTIDSRLGSNEDFAFLCEQFHNSGIRVVLDGVFNHVGRGFWAFRDVQEKKQNSQYKDWFYIDWNKNSDRNDGFYYEGWEGCNDLVKLNLQNPAVVEHLFGAISKWVELFKIDGIRLDVAYSLDPEFCKKLHSFVANFECGGIGPLPKDKIVLIGEILFGDYRRLVNSQMLDSCTNYECYKGIFSSLNDENLFEVNYSLNRQYGGKNNQNSSDKGMYKNFPIFNFVDNHDVSRIASILKNEQHIQLAYALLFTMPGVPCLYYGSEWGQKGKKEDGDNGLRPRFENPQWNDLTTKIQKLINIHKSEKGLLSLEFETLCIANQAIVFKRGSGTEEVIVCINCSSYDYGAKTNLHGNFRNLLTNETFEIKEYIFIPSNSYLILKRT